MRSKLTKTLLATVALAAALSLGSQAATSATSGLVGTRVDNFMLPDQTGLGHELYYHADKKAVVLLTTARGDAASERALAALTTLKAQFASQGVEFFALDSKDPAQNILNVAATPVPVLADELQLVGRSLGVNTTAEALVLDPKTWRVVYHGPVDESFAAGRAPGASVKSALEAVLAGRTPSVAAAAVKGTKVDFPDRAKKAQFARISYSNEVAPILANKCVTCHTVGGMGPFAMSSYEAVKGFSPMIRETIRTNRMPPFHADPHYGAWQNNMNLTAAEKKTLVNWIEAGSPRGGGADPLAARKSVLQDWPMGKPDLIVNIPAFDVPANGVVDYQDRSIASNLTEGRWLKATAWKVGATPVVHHVLAGWMPEVRADGRGFSWNTSMGGYGPGGENNLSPESTGTYLPPGGSFSFQMHYTPVGKAMRDQTQVGLYFYKEEPKFILRQASVTDFSLEIPAGKARHHERAYLEFPKDALLYGTQPHCHSRCYSTKLTLRYPDGREKILLNQPRYDFGWQREYIFDQLLEVPAGSKLIADYIFDNSTANKSNPDPKRNVTFGEQTADEMLFTFVRFRWKDETSTSRKDDFQAALNANVMFGALDDDIDGKVTVVELRNSPMFAPFKASFPLVDANKDGGLDKTEMATAMGAMGRMGRSPTAGLDRGAAALTGQR